MRLLALCFLTTGLAFAQATSTTPDCQFQEHFAGNGTGTARAAQSTASGTPCVKWRISWQTSGPTAFSALSVNFNGAPNSGAGPGTFVLWSGTGTNEVGTNPGTTATNGTFVVGPGTAAQGIYFPWVQITVTGAMGTGTIDIKVLGYRGTTPAAPGSAGTLPSNVNIADVAGVPVPVLNGSLPTFNGCDSHAEVALSGTGYTQIVAGTAMEIIYLCKVFVTGSSGGNPVVTTFTLAFGTCAGSPTEAMNAAGVTGIDSDFGGSMRGTAADAFCVKESVADSDKVTVTYAKF